MCSSAGICRSSSRSRSASSGATGSGAHYALCALGVGLIALGIVMIVWTVIPLDGENQETAAAANSTVPADNDDEEKKDRTQSSSVAMVLVGVGATMLFLSICLGVRSKRRARNQPVQTGVLPVMAHVAGEQEEPAPDPATFSVPSYEEAVGSGNYPVRQSNLRNSMTHLPSYEDIIAAVENEGAEPTTTIATNNNHPPTEETPLNGPAPAQDTAETQGEVPERNPSLPTRSSSRVSRLFQPLRVRRIKSDKLHLKDFRLQIRTPTTNPVTIEPITPPPGYENKMPELNQS
ncbi:transmembrane protein 51b [Eucyclogobius newberryi]|uniref:transmembrane protein 51b n=1 Tax=Eucyclogobius newberryi TaxID=166745 RepID=UPI003B5C7818